MAGVKKLTEEEKYKKEIQDLIQSNKDLAAEIKELNDRVSALEDELEDDELLASGYLGVKH